MRANWPPFPEQAEKEKLAREKNNIYRESGGLREGGPDAGHPAGSLPGGGGRHVLRPMGYPAVKEDADVH